MALTEQLIRDTYSSLKQKARVYLEKGKIQKGLLYTHLAAYTNYNFWLSYHDEEIEELLVNASKAVIQRQYDTRDVIAGRCVMLDSLARYRGGLTVQYVKAIMAAGWELLYITEQEMSAPHHMELLSFLNKYEKIRVVEVPNNINGKEKLQFVYDQIVGYGAERLYLHSSSSDILFPAVCYALPPSLQKFYVDMADHGFRVGMNSCDYNFQFRSLGCSIAVQKRGVSREELLYLPFYPVMDVTEFKGFPSECEGKVVVLSGGIFWKIIDKDDTFFKLCKQTLEQNPQAVILYLGGGDATFVKEKLLEYGIADRLILLGWRDDICELFRHCDVFLNTYPHGGGTMSLYAAHLKKPILSYAPDESCVNPIEKFICQRDNMKITSIGFEEFLTEANHLISDETCRSKKGEREYGCVIPEKDFNTLFKEMSISHKNIVSYKDDDALGDTNSLMQKKIDFHNRQGEYQMRMVALSGLNSITLNKEFLKPFALKILPKIKRVVSERGFHFNRI